MMLFQILSWSPLQLESAKLSQPILTAQVVFPVIGRVIFVHADKQARFQCVLVLVPSNKPETPRLRTCICLLVCVVLFYLFFLRNTNAPILVKDQKFLFQLYGHPSALVFFTVSFSSQVQADNTNVRVSLVVEGEMRDWSAKVRIMPDEPTPATPSLALTVDPPLLLRDGGKLSEILPGRLFWRKRNMTG